VPEVQDLSVTTRPKSTHLATAAGIGIVVGLLIGVYVVPPQGSMKREERLGVGAAGQTYTQALSVLNASPASWKTAPLTWNRLGPFSKAGQAPQTFSIPALLFDYGAMTDAITADTVTDDIVLRLDVSDTKGAVGVSLVNPKGNPLVSEEQQVTKDDRERTVLFLVKSKELPASVLLRNYADQSGNKGSITVKAVTYAHYSALSDKEKDAVKAIGLNKGL
jgi:hypothetical protein